MSRTDLSSEDVKRHLAEVMSNFTPPDFNMLEARSLAFSTHAVITATQRGSTAEADFQLAA